MFDNTVLNEVNCKRVSKLVITFEKKLFSVEDDIDLSGLLSDDDSSFLPKETVQSASKTSSDTAKLSTTEPSSIPKSSTATKQASPIKNTKEATSNYSLFVFLPEFGHPVTFISKIIT